MQEPQLPKGIEPSDLERPQHPEFKGKNTYKQYETWLNKPENHIVDQFEMWFTPGFGWCIPTLLIRHASGRRAARGFSDRTYAVPVSDSTQIVRIGLGPHVTKQVQVYVRESRLEALKPFLNMRLQGQASAGMVRDRISSRRAQTAMRRADSFLDIFGRH